MKGCVMRFHKLAPGKSTGNLWINFVVKNVIIKDTYKEGEKNQNIPQQDCTSRTNHPQTSESLPPNKKRNGKGRVV